MLKVRVQYEFGYIQLHDATTLLQQQVLQQCCMQHVIFGYIQSMQPVEMRIQYDTVNVMQ